MKVKPLILLLFLVQLCHANMASPHRDGTRIASAFSSKDINILSESILIEVEDDFQTAKFTVEYTIQSDTLGKQIPLLFCALNYDGDFNVWIDNEPVLVQEVNEEYRLPGKPPFAAFDNTLNHLQDGNDILIYWHENGASHHRFNFNDLKYFEANITESIHKIRVEYTAKVWTDWRGWLRERSFRYSLSPASFWKSFGTLEVTVVQKGTVREYTTNLGIPQEKKIEARNTWIFEELPAQYFDITYKSTPSSMAKALIFLEPGGLTVILAVILFALHLCWTCAYRRKSPYQRYSIPVILGGLIVPGLILLSFMLFYDLIDWVIGDDASGRHGYTFFILFLYPVLMPVYWLIVWLIDWIYKQKQMRSLNRITRFTTKHQKRIFFLTSTIVLLIIEVLIALFLNDRIIRPYVGDILVTMLIYCFVRSIFISGIKRLPLYIFIFAIEIELLQYINFVEIMGLSDNALARTIIGTSFSWIDIICYGIGCLVCYLYEKYERRWR